MTWAELGHGGETWRPGDRGVAREEWFMVFCAQLEIVICCSCFEQKRLWFQGVAIEIRCHLDPCLGRWVQAGFLCKHPKTPSHLAELGGVLGSTGAPLPSNASPRCRRKPDLGTEGRTRNGGCQDSHSVQFSSATQRPKATKSEPARSFNSRSDSL